MTLPRARRAGELLLAGLVAALLLVLAIRAAVRLDQNWDGLWYHATYASWRAGIPSLHGLDERMTQRYQGFPPLPHLIQGLLWRATGSLHAAGFLNWIGLLLFLLGAHRVLGAPWWLVGALALPAPLVLIHATILYVDLFGNALLALGLLAIARASLDEGPPAPGVVAVGLAGLAGAAWSKYLLLPLALLGWAGLGALVLARGGPGRRRALAGVAAGGLVLALPYGKNLVVYGNPFWPIKAPLVGELFTYAFDEADEIRRSQRPPPLVDRSQPELFARSLLEIGHEADRASLPQAPRWTADMRGGNLSFRSGGLWAPGAAALLLLALALPAMAAGRRGGVVSTGVALLLGVGACLHLSHVLRYYLVWPLLWAGVIALAYPRLSDTRPRLAGAILVTAIAFFVLRIHALAPHALPVRQGWEEAARFYHAHRWWPLLLEGETLHVARQGPMPFLLTGPTGREYRVQDHRDAATFPADAPRIHEGRLVAPDAYWERLLATRPSALGYLQRAVGRYLAGELPGARADLDQARARAGDGTLLPGATARTVDNQPAAGNHFDLAWFRAFTGARLGDPELAGTAYREMAALAPDRAPGQVVELLRPFFRPGYEAAGLRVVEHLRAVHPRAWWVHENEATLATRAGDAARAARARAVAQALRAAADQR